jgi:hypothetical protein
VWGILADFSNTLPFSAISRLTHLDTLGATYPFPFWSEIVSRGSNLRHLAIESRNSQLYFLCREMSDDAFLPKLEVLELPMHDFGSNSASLIERSRPRVEVTYDDAQ